MIICIGDLLIDVLMRRQARDGADTIALHPGGSAANVAAWLAHLGVPCGFVGAAGADLAGDVLVEDLRRRDVMLAVSRHTAAPSGLLLLETLPDGGTRAAAQRGANDLLALDGDQRALLAGATWLHLSMYAFYAEGSRPSLLAAIASAHARGVPVSLDLGAPHLLAHIGDIAYLALLRQAAPNVLLANEEEARLLAGLPYNAPGDLDEQRAPQRDPAHTAPRAGDPRYAPRARTLDVACAALAALAPTIAIKRGARGCVARAGDQQTTVHAPPVDAVVDTTGAGDAFVAGFIAALRAGRTLAEAATQGVSCGTRCVTMRGGRPPR